MKNLDTFKNDFVNGIHTAYCNGNIQFNSAVTDFDTVSLEYIDMMNRLIGPKKRTVRISKTLNKKMKTNNPEARRIKRLVMDMKKKMKNGVDVNGHLSKTIFKHKEDKFFDDWNMSHLHLCFGNPSVFDFSRAQSGDLLMVVITSTIAYFVDVTDHSPEDWYKKELLKTIKDSWEEELMIRHDDIIGVSQIFDSVEDIKKIRNANINNIIYEIDGKHYSVKNSFGYSIAGKSNKAMLRLMNLKKYIEHLDFDYKSMIFHDFCVNRFCTIYNQKGEYIEIVINLE